MTEKTKQDTEYLSHDCLNSSAGLVWQSNLDSIKEWSKAGGLSCAHYSSSEFVEGTGPIDTLETELPAVAIVEDTVWLKRSIESIDLIHSLDLYPLLDDEKHSTLQSELEKESWESWIESDLSSYLFNFYSENMNKLSLFQNYDSLGDWLEDNKEEIEKKLPPDYLYQAYLEAQDLAGVYPIEESVSHSNWGCEPTMWIDVERISKDFCSIVLDYILEKL